MAAGLEMQMLREALKPGTTDYSKNPELKQAVWNYFIFLADHMARNQHTSFVHSPDYFWTRNRRSPMATKDQRTQHASHSIDESAIERSNQVIRQLADVGIKVGGYSLGRKLGPAKPSTKGKARTAGNNYSRIETHQMMG